MDKKIGQKRTPLKQWWHEFCGGIPLQHKRDFEDKKIETNLSRTLVFSLFIIAIQIFLNTLNIILPSTGGDSDIMKFVYLSLFSLSTGIVYLLISIAIKRKHFKNRRFRQIFPFTLIYLYCIIQMIFLAFNVEAGAGMNPYIIALIALGFFLVMRPIQCIGSIIVLFFTALAILVVIGAENDALGTILVTDNWANLLIITCLIAVMSTVFYKIYFNNFLNQKRLEISNERLNKLAKTDELTGLLNRWGFFDQLDNTWSEYQKNPGIISVFMFDLDHFKDYNDTYGHPAGDACLKQVARSMNKVFSKTDNSIISRFGGEEFLVVVHTDTKREALDLAKNMQDHLYETTSKLIKGSKNTGVTISGGVATVHTSDTFTSIDDLIDKADRLLYKVKSSSRGQILTTDTH